MILSNSQGANCNGGSNGGRVSESPLAAQTEPVQWQQVSAIRPNTGFGF